MPETLKEAQIEAKVVRYCREHRLYTRKFSSPAHRGVPDRIIAGRGKVLFLELKREGGRLTPLQTREIDELRSHGQHAAVAWSFSEARRVIDRLFFPINAQDIIG